MNNNEILKIYGTDYKNMTVRLLTEAGLENDIRDTSLSIGIKPNLVTSSPATFGATTHPEIIEGIIEYLQSRGFKNISILEGSWAGDNTEEAFEYCGYNAISKKYGVPLINTKHDSVCKTDAAGLELNICQKALETDFLINVPVLKGHCQTRMTCALKNMKGLIPDSEKRRFHKMGLHKPIAHLNTAIKQSFIVVDNICGDHDFEEGGNPVTTNCIFVSKDPVLTDALACEFLGFKASDVDYVSLAGSLGIGCADTSEAQITIIDGAPEAVEDASPRRSVLDVSYAADEVDSCSVCYASLVPALIKLKEEGLLDRLSAKIAIGQGHRGKGGFLGVGNCTSGFEHCVKGCPPSQEEIYASVKDIILTFDSVDKNDIIRDA